MSRAYALRRLAQQFPASSDAAMRPEDRRTLRSLAREHLAAMQKDFARIQNTMNPVLEGIGASAGVGEMQAGSSEWQTASEQLLATARRVETLTAVVLGAAPANSAGDAPSQLLNAMGQLTSGIQQCHRLLSYD